MAPLFSAEVKRFGDSVVTSVQGYRSCRFVLSRISGILVTSYVCCVLKLRVEITE